MYNYKKLRNKNIRNIRNYLCIYFTHNQWFYSFVLFFWVSQAQTARNSTWYNIYEVSDPDASTLSIDDLTPFMQYKLRLIANNVVGASQPSEPTKEFQTIQAPPSHPPKNVTVRAMSATELRVRWIVSSIII